MNYHYDNSNKDYSFDFNLSILILYQFFNISYFNSQNYYHYKNNYDTIIKQNKVSFI